MKTKVISGTTKFVQKMALAIVGVAIFFVLWIGYLLFSPVDILEVEVPIPASPTEVEAGGTVSLNFDYCKYRDFESRIKVDFIGDYVIPTLSTTRHFEVGCHSEKLVISIPSGTPNGEYRLRLQVEYQVNLLRREEYAFESVKIAVNNPEEGEQVDIGDTPQ